MKPAFESRKGVRLNHEATIMIEDCTTGYYHYASMVNFSGDGIYCKSDTALNPGASVNIKIEKVIYKSAPNSYIGEVRWCKELDRNDSSHAYGIGIKVFKAAQYCNELP